MKRIDETGFGNLKLVQDPEQFCYGVDAVILADFAKLKRNDTVLDLCSGNGIVAFVLAHKFGCGKITGIELQREPFLLAKESLELNRAELEGCGSRLEFINADAKDAAELLGEESVSAITCNPPYFEKERGVAGEGGIKHAARFESTAGLEDFISVSSRLLKNKGSLSLIHRPERLPDIMEHLRKYNLEPKRMRLVSDKPGSVPRQLLIQAVKGGGKELALEPLLWVHEDDNNYSAEIQAIYERG